MQWSFPMGQLFGCNGIYEKAWKVFNLTDNFFGHMHLWRCQKHIFAGHPEVGQLKLQIVVAVGRQ